jgi:hypothetical protein
MMSRISIDVTPEEHQKLKAMAALRGKSIKEFVLASTLGAHGEDNALRELEALLDKRLENARAAGVSSGTVQDIVKQVTREASEPGPDG